MYILNSKQLSDVDQLTIQIEGISSWDLMERAAISAESEILKHLINFKNTIHILCGMGNNGGDGLSIAYHLHQKGFAVKVYKVAYAEKASSDFIINEKRLKNKTSIVFETIQDYKESQFTLTKNDILIDAIFGVGLNRKMPTFVENLIQNLNNLNAFTIAIDVPSGMFINQETPKEAVVFNTDVCLTFQLPKLAFLLPKTGQFLKNWKLIPIGLDKKSIQEQNSPYLFMDLSFAKKRYKLRTKFSHKGTYGTSLLVGGQTGMLGSILLAAKAALRSGVGKLNVMLPANGHANLPLFIPEALAVPHSENEHIYFTETTHFKSVGIGMGIGTSNKVASVFKAYLRQCKCPLLIDADGINLLAKHTEWLQLLPENTILTPHPGELKRLIGEWKNDFEKLKKIQQLAKKFKLIIVVKDAYTCICNGSKFYFNSTGNAGMATAGSGDVLSGIISALLAQSYTPLEAAQVGVFIHGLAGDLALESQSMESLIASDIISYLGKAFHLLSDEV